ncbi:MAG: cytochrome-c peroxidase [Nitrospiraceae bacterium]|nr:cytochrome-c peroxidase [Nitrospiraceae bacterium]
MDNHSGIKGRRLFVFFLLFLFAGALRANADDLMARAQALFKPIPASPPALANNPVTPEKLKLGRMLYFEPRLSDSALISCNTCHNLGMGGADFQETSTGHGWKRGPRNAPTVFNAVFNIAQFWDGRASTLMEQAKGPVQASVEMNNTPGKVVRTLKSMPRYVELFKKSFPGEADPVTFNNMARAIEVFEATLLTPDSRFDRYLKGDSNSLSPYEKEGLSLFMGKGCANCHGGINMGGTGYYTFGLVERPPAEIMVGDVGRYKVTKTKSDEYAFKAPSLRNIELTPPYFHSGKVWSLKHAVAIMGSAQLGIKLNDAETDRIAAFLKTTTGVQPRVEYPILPAPAATTPRPEL